MSSSNPRIVTYGKYAPIRGLFLSSPCIKISQFCPFLHKVWDRNKFSRRYCASNFVRCNPQDSHVHQVRYAPCGFFFRIIHLNIAFFMLSTASSWGTYTSTHLLRSSRREPQRRRRSKCQAPDESTPVTWGSCFSTQVTSGIMRERHLMCACRVCPLPAGLGESQWGETPRGRGES